MSADRITIMNCLFLTLFWRIEVKGWIEKKISKPNGINKEISRMTLSPLVSIRKLVKRMTMVYEIRKLRIGDMKNFLKEFFLPVDFIDV